MENQEIRSCLTQVDRIGQQCAAGQESPVVLRAALQDAARLIVSANFSFQEELDCRFQFEQTVMGRAEKLVLDNAPDASARRLADEMLRAAHEIVSDQSHLNQRRAALAVLPVLHSCQAELEQLAFLVKNHEQTLSHPHMNQAERVADLIERAQNVIARLNDHDVRCIASQCTPATQAVITERGMRPIQQLPLAHEIIQTATVFIPEKELRAALAARARTQKPRPREPSTIRPYTTLHNRLRA